MFISVLITLSVTSVIQLYLTEAVEELPYECGAHGKFEYCVDGVPNCVVGCHCHPGYYFDTDTKICEPNTKLTQDFHSRRFMVEPSRLNSYNVPVESDVPTPTPTSVLNEDPKDTDELGDWLYNQFFKTIETQVMNNTTNDSTENLSNTRRSGNDVIRPGDGKKRGLRKRKNANNKIKGNTRKSRKSKTSKKKKVHGLRRKLLRISEDDSLFESDSDDDDDGDDDDDDNSSSSSSSSSSSGESKSSKGTDDKNNNGDHGHKKVIIYNRRPRPPLPSFIFLPSMNTPYYPPVGLQPPPAMPMYPMVPVPPMPPMIFDSGYKTGPHTTPSSTPNGVTESSTVASTTVAPKVETVPPAVTEVPHPIESLKRIKSRFHKLKRLPSKASEDKVWLRSNDMEPSPFTNKQIERYKLIRKLKERMLQKAMPLVDVINDTNEEQTSLLDDLAFLQAPSSVYPSLYKETHRSKELAEKGALKEEHNFKYISELIHRTNGSNLKTPQLSTSHKTKQQPQLEKSRRSYVSPPAVYTNVETGNHNKAQDPNIFFTNLGRQIATLIRNADSNINYNKESNKNMQKDTYQSLLNENHYAPRSYWERSIRSPFVKNPIEAFNLFRPSQEQNLFSLENEISSFVTTQAPLSLQDLENVLKKIENIQTEINRKPDRISDSNASLNINLLPYKQSILKDSTNPVDYTDTFAPIPTRGIPPILNLINNDQIPYYYGPHNFLGTKTISHDKQSSLNTNIPHNLIPTNGIPRTINLSNNEQSSYNTNGSNNLVPTVHDYPLDDWVFNSNSLKSNKKLKQKPFHRLQENTPTNNKTLEGQDMHYKLTNLLNQVNKQLTKTSQEELIKTLKNIRHSTESYNYISKQFFETRPHQTPKYPDRLVLLPERADRRVKIKYPQRRAMNPVWPMYEFNQDDSATNQEQSSKYDKPTSYLDQSANNRELPVKHPERRVNYLDHPLNYPQQSIEYISGQTITTEDPRVPSEYHAHKPPTIERLKYFDNSKNGHFMFEASYPLTGSERDYPNVDLTSDPESSDKPLYFREFHHFDFFD